MISDLPDTRQIVVVAAESWPAVNARLFCIEKRPDAWIHAGSCDAVVGCSGMGWGPGIHEPSGEGPVKKEGDERAPAGVFPLLSAMGYAAAAPSGTSLPYEQITETHCCIDDPASPHYNSIIDASRHPKPAELLGRSSELMKRTDALYAWLIVVDYNRKEPKPGAGSCIFIHVWRSKDEGTAGCTAIAEKNMVKLLQWLRPEHHPLLIQMPMPEYEQRRGKWGLPLLEKRR